MRALYTACLPSPLSAWLGHVLQSSDRVIGSALWRAAFDRRARRCATTRHRDRVARRGASTPAARRTTGKGDGAERTPTAGVSRRSRHSTWVGLGSGGRGRRLDSASTVVYAVSRRVRNAGCRSPAGSARRDSTRRRRVRNQRGTPRGRPDGTRMGGQITGNLPEGGSNYFYRSNYW